MGGRGLEGVKGAVEKAEAAELDAELALAQFDLLVSDWLALVAFDGSQIGAFGSSFLIGRFDFEQGPGHNEPNLVNSCAIVM